MSPGDKWKLLVATPDESEAFLVKRLLDGEGIPCRITTDTTYPSEGRGARARERKVYVPLEDFEAGMQALQLADRDRED